MATAEKHSLSIVIPAYNEEDAIASTIDRCLAARHELAERLGLEHVEVIVVSDGSSDRTNEIAGAYDEITLIVFERNRGYGAAIKEGFRRARGTLVSFLDADGTCDPREFLSLCPPAMNGADVVLGSRMGAGSRMPAVRRLGNRIYALLLGVLCGKHVSDTASGMRVLRRSSLSLLYPLPDGLHFTPSMSARALLGGLRVVEVPISYEERVGESKLHVLRDGIRFFGTIFSGVLLYRPERLFLMAFTACLALTVLLSAFPVEFYLANRWIKDWMIYRFVACFLLGSAGFLLLCATTLAYHLSFLKPGARADAPFWPALIASFFDSRALGVFLVVTFGISTFLIAPGIAEYLHDGHVRVHWSKVLVAAFGYLVIFQALVTRILIAVITIYRDEETATKTLAGLAPLSPASQVA